MKRVLEEIKDNIVCVYKDKKHTEKFFVGYIIAFDDTFLLLECIDENGTIDGISVVNLKDIYLIEVNNKYITNIEKKNPKKIKINIDNTNNIFQNYLKYIIHEQKIVDIETNGSETVDLHGVVIDITDGWIVLESYENEKVDGKSYCRLENITMIDYK